MGLLSRRRPPAAVTASAAKATVKSPSARRQALEWQLRAFEYYDLLGAIKYAGNFFARNLSNIRVFPAFLDENGEPQETEDAKIRDLLDRIKDPNGGRSSLLGNYGRQRFLVGESYLTATYDEELGEKWEMLSLLELRVTGEGTYTRQGSPETGTVELKALPDGETALQPGFAIVYRLWRPHPVWSGRADSSLEGVLGDCEELLLLQAAVRARVRSRLAGPGMLVMADDISPPPPEPVGDEDMVGDPFYEDLIEAVTEPIQNEGTAAAAVPFLVRVGAERVQEGFNFISFRDSNEEYREVTLRDEALKRVAIGLDMPPEVLLGLAEVNHWSAWQVDESTFKAHIQPVCQELCDDLTSAYLRPAAREAGVKDWEHLVVGYDAAAIINHPDRAKDAKDLWALGAVGFAALRDACDFDDDDAPTEVERAERIGIATRDSSLAWYGIPSVKAGGIEPEPGEIENAQGSQDTPTGPTTGAEVEAGPPPDGPPDTVASARILGAAELAVERSRSLAGSRIRTRANNSCAECKQTIGAVPQRLVAAALGFDQVRLLPGIPGERALVQGGADDLVETLHRWNLPAVAARAIGDQVEAHAARTLYDVEPTPLPVGFDVFVGRLLEPQLVAA
jgi:hypothetical protein